MAKRKRSGIKGLIGVYDNRGKTLDRYTVALLGREYSASPGYHACLSLSPDPERGVSQFGDCKVGRHLGKKISFGKLPKNVQRHVKERLR